MSYGWKTNTRFYQMSLRKERIDQGIRRLGIFRDRLWILNGMPPLPDKPKYLMRSFVPFFLTAFIWVTNYLIGLFEFFTGTLVIDSLILTAAVWIVSLFTCISRRVKKHDAEEVMRNCGVPVTK